MVSYETIRQWCQKFGPHYARKLKRREGRLGDERHLDEIFIRSTATSSICGVDQDGIVFDILIQPHRDQRAAERFFRRLLRGQGAELAQMITDKLRSYFAAIQRIFDSVAHIVKRYANNRGHVRCGRSLPGRLLRISPKAPYFRGRSAWRCRYGSAYTKIPWAWL